MIYFKFLIVSNFKHLIYEVQVYYTNIYEVTKFQGIMCEIETFYRNRIT